MTTQTTEPTSFRAGDSASWERTFAGYLPADGWALAYRLVPRGAGSAIDIATVAAGESFAATLAATTTAAWAAGDYTLVGVLSKGAERVTVYSRACEVLPDLMAASATDARTTPAKIVEAIDAWMLGKAGWAGEKQVADRRIKDHPLPELLALRDYYAKLAAGERTLEALLSGAGASSRVNVRM